MPLDFPASPSLNDTYSFGGKTWIWNGEGWALNTSGAINDIPIGNVTANTGNFTTLSVQTGVSSNLVPTANVTYDLGADTARWNDLWLANSTIHIGNGSISANATSLILTNPDGNTFEAGGTPGGSNTQIQFNDDGVFAGSADLIWDGSQIAVTGAVTATGNISGGNLISASLGSAGNTAIIGTNNTLTSTSSLYVDTANNRIGVGTVVPERTFDLVGNAAFTGDVQITQFNNSSDSGGIRVRKSRGADNAPSAVVDNDIVGSIEFFLRDTSAFQQRASITSVSQVSGSTYGADLAFGTGNGAGPTTRLYIAEGGAITFNGAYTFPTSDGSANAVLATNGTGTLSFTATPTFSTVTATGNITGGNLTTAGLISATGNITGGNLSGTSIVGTLTTAAQTNITSVGTLTSLTSSGNIQGANVIATTDVFTPEIVKTGSNGAGNIGQSDNTFNTVFAKATSAQYADVAERYLADLDYPTGTVLVFGGDQEVTQSQIDHGTAIAGTVSHKPAYVMNNGLEGDHVVSVALLGRVPVRVIGTIRPGDLLVASELPGIATSLVPDRYAPGCVIGKALESYDSQREGVIEAVVGRL